MILTERLTVNGVEIGITNYSVKAPAGGLGLSVTVSLAKPDITAIPPDAVIKFEIGAGKIESGAAVYSWLTVFDTGKLVSRSFTVKWIPDKSGGFAGDLVEFSSLSPAADKLAISPARPVIMFDPAKIASNALEAKRDTAIRLLNENGGTTPLLPQTEPVENLSLHQILQRAYVTGCGFSNVITNIPNNSVDRADFTIEGGFHGGASGFYSMFDIVTFEQDNILFLIDPAFELPETINAFRTLSLDCVSEVVQSKEGSAGGSNAVLLSYRPSDSADAQAGEDPPDIEIIYDDPIEQGEGRAYSRIESSREIVTFRDSVSGEVRREYENWEETETYAYRDEITVTEEDGEITRERSAGGVRLIQFERLTNRYTGHCKSGHTRTIEALYQNPETGGGWDFGEVLREENQTDFTADLQRAGAYIQVRSATLISGLVIKETKEDGLEIYTPVLEAAEAGIVETEDQTLDYLPIVTIIEELKGTGQNQANVVPRIIPHLNGGANFAPLQSRVGNRSTYLPPFALRGGGNPQTVRELIQDAASVEAFGLRRPVPFDAGQVSQDLARQLGRRKLAALIDPPENYSVIFPSIDFLIRRGSLIIPPLRDGLGQKQIVKGYTITGRGIGTAQAWRNMTLETTEVKNDN